MWAANSELLLTLRASKSNRKYVHPAKALCETTTELGSSKSEKRRKKSIERTSEPAESRGPCDQEGQKILRDEKEADGGICRLPHPVEADNRMSRGSRRPPDPGKEAKRPIGSG